MEKGESDLMWLREKLSIGQKELSEFLGIDRTFLSHLEKNKRSMSPKIMKRWYGLLSLVEKIDKRQGRNKADSAPPKDTPSIKKAQKVNDQTKYEIENIQRQINALKSRYAANEKSILIFNQLMPDDDQTEVEKRRLKKWTDYLLSVRINDREKYTAKRLLELEIRLASRIAAYNVVRSYLGK